MPTCPSVEASRGHSCTMRQCAGMSPLALSCLATGHEDVLRAVVVERLAGESTIERFEPQARDVEEPQPFVLVAHQSEPVPPSSKVMSTRLSLTL